MKVIPLPHIFFDIAAYLSVYHESTQCRTKRTERDSPLTHHSISLSYANIYPYVTFVFENIEKLKRLLNLDKRNK